MFDDTIAAIASAPGGALRGIIRLSGPHVGDCLQKCFTADSVAEAKQTRRAHWQDGRLTLGDAALPCRTYLWPTSRSYTGQPAAELHTVGSPPLLELALARICENGARLAGPGEFTLRAFLSGRIDLPKAEAVLAVIDAHDDQHLRRALGQLAGGLSRPLNDLRDELLNLLAELEAGLDFVEEDIEFISADELLRRVSAVHRSTTLLFDSIGERSLEQASFRVALVGSPNVGKSSLMNALADRPAAIVSDQAGTTRDYVDTTVDLDGVTISMVDTAGIDLTSQLSGPDQLAQNVTVDKADEADLRLVCLDASRPLANTDQKVLQTYADRDNTIVVLTKTDLPRRIAIAESVTANSLETSSTDRTGLDELRMAIRERLVGDEGSDLMVASTAARCRDSLRLTVDSLDRAISLAETSAGEELVAAELRVALDELGKVVGATYTDDILDRIFSRFCIGK